MLATVNRTASIACSFGTFANANPHTGIDFSRFSILIVLLLVFDACLGTLRFSSKTVPFRTAGLLCLVVLVRFATPKFV